MMVGMSIPAILVAAAAYLAGWYYLFYSPAARRLDGVERSADNRRRQRLRRANGVVLLLLATLFYVGFVGVDPDRHKLAYLLVWTAVLALLLAAVLLATVDLLMTARVRRQAMRQTVAGGDR